MNAPHPYASDDYAKALSGLGETFHVPQWNGFVVLRPIDGGGADAIGPYPRTPLAADADLEGGIERLRAAGLVSVTLVPDPARAPPPARLAGSFAVCQPFKTHQVIDRARPGGFQPTKHHRDEIRRGRRRCRIERVRLSECLPAWLELYTGLVARHGITGAATFPEPYFTALARMPAFDAFAAFVGESLAAMTLWFEHAGVAVSHLAAANSLGYANSASYALNDVAIEYYSGAALIDLGAGAGLHDDPADGLAQFKRGFANTELVAYLCGAVLEPARYAELARGRRATGFFPVYRG